jgi:hypothetical protein
MPNLVQPPCFWNKLHQVHTQASKHWKAKLFETKKSTAFILLLLKSINPEKIE